MFSVSIALSLLYILVLREYFDPSTDFSVEMVKRVLIRYGVGKLLVLNHSDPRMRDVLRYVNMVLDNVGERLLKIYTDDILVNVLNNSTYIDIYFNRRYSFKLANEEVEASRVIIFLDGVEKGVVMIDRGIVRNIHIWLCWSIDYTKPSFQSLTIYVTELEMS